MKFLTASVTGLLTGVLSFANAQVFIADNANVNYAINNDVIVGYANQSDFDSRTNGIDPTINVVSGGYLWLDVSLYNQSTLKLSDGTIDGPLTAYDNASIVQTGGIISDLLLGTGNSQILITGGNTGNLAVLSGSSRFTMAGGHITSAVIARHSSLVNLRGGSVPQIAALEDAQINVYGSDLIEALINPNASGTSQYTLSGFLEDGTDITGLTVFVQNGNGARLNLFNIAAVPEANTLTLFAGLFAVNRFCVLGRRRKQSKR